MTDSITVSVKIDGREQGFTFDLDEDENRSERLLTALFRSAYIAMATRCGNSAENLERFGVEVPAPNVDDVNMFHVKQL